MGKNIFTYKDGKKMKLLLKDLKVFSMKRTAGTYRQCFKIVPMERHFYWFDSDGSTHGYSFKITFLKSPIPLTMQLYVTSERNSYGAIFEKWHDGHVEPYTLKKSYSHFPLVSEVKETHYLSHLCLDQSYFLCLASELANNSSCPDDGCISFTLPTQTKFEDKETCNFTYDFLDPTTRTCKTEVMMSLNTKENVCKGDTKKSCVVQEYLVEDFVSEFPTRNGHFNVIFRVDSPKSPHGGLRMSLPHKTVYTEHYLLDEFQLIGTIGGTLGLMIGFSFVTCIKSTTNFALSWIKRSESDQTIDIQEVVA